MIPGKVGDLKNTYSGYVERGRKDLDRQRKNWRMYTGLDYGQWEERAVTKLMAESRHPTQINITFNKVQTLAGGFVQDPYEGRFENDLGDNNDATLILNEMYFSDKDRCNWVKAKRLQYLAGLIHRGISEMYKDYRTDPLGAVGLRYVDPSKVIFDPEWASDNINDNERIFMVAWMSPKQIKDTYHKKSAAIKDAIYKFEEYQQKSQTRDADVQKTFDDSSQYFDRLNGKYLVIQELSLEIIAKKKIIDSDEWKELPEMDEVNTAMMMALNRGNLKCVSEQFAKVKLMTVCPSLDIVLEEGYHPMQIGRYPLFVWSMQNVHGDVLGAVDLMADLQTSLNKNVSTYTHWQSTRANGVEFFEDGFFLDPTTEKRYIEQGNIPGSKFKVSSGALSQSKPGIFSKTDKNSPDDLLITADRTVNFMDMVSATPAAITGGEGKSGESAKLFGEKRAQAMTALELTTQSLQDFERELTDAYFYAVKHVYGGAPRKIKNRKTGNIINLNVIDPSGEIINNVDAIPRHSVIVALSKSSVSMKRELLNTYNQALTVIQNPILRAYTERQMIKQIPNMPESDVAIAEDAAKLFEKLQTLRIEAESLQIQAGIKQLEMQMQAPPAPPGGMPPGAPGAPPGMNPNDAPATGPNRSGRTPAEGGGMSVEGANIPPTGGVTADVNQANQLK
jgi:hypothetical protein